ncbi:hypothetical protein K435DRAFT_838940 [Dendrothele bispora CBS 962.96]|uniref:DUF6699 domain-containing protein n=1 Tax=Dendrothele bispora (strain CBS 962.96) TaxID=1314807 RepID=A0A4S8M530_DENBC|nr:hypothetical protein K435DRAFT_838940 [Dendrothele bispora CBS 962.96]
MSCPDDRKRLSTGTHPRSQQHLRKLWPLRIPSCTSQKYLDQYSNTSTKDVAQQFKTYLDQWFTVIEGADSLNKERRVLDAKNDCSQNLVILAIVLACRVNGVPAENDSTSDFDYAAPPSVESFTEEFLSHAETVSGFFNQDQDQNQNQNHSPSSTTKSQTHSSNTGSHSLSPQTSRSPTLLNSPRSNLVQLSLGQGPGQGMAPPSPPGRNGRGSGSGSSSRHGTGSRGSGSTTTTNLGGNRSRGRTNNASDGNSSHDNSISPPNSISAGNHNSRGSSCGNDTARPRIGGTRPPPPPPGGGGAGNDHNGSHTSDAGQFLAPPHSNSNSPRRGRGGNVPQGNVPNPNPNPNPNPGVPQCRNRNRNQNHQQQPDTSLGSSGPRSGCDNPSNSSFSFTSSTNGGRQCHRSATQSIQPTQPAQSTCSTSSAYNQASFDPFALQVHHHLSPRKVQLDSPVLQWDITQCTKKARLLTRERLNLKEPAVVYGNAATSTLEMGHNNKKKIYKVRIGSDDPRLGWWMRNVWEPLIIENERGKEVSVGDVLEGIYKYLAKPLTVSDYERVGNNLESLRTANQVRIFNSSQRRMKDLGSLDITGSDWKGGWTRGRETFPGGVPNAGEVVMVSGDYRRSDVLLSMKKFAGLRSMVQDDGTWMLYLGLALDG